MLHGILMTFDQIGFLNHGICLNASGFLFWVLCHVTGISLSNHSGISGAECSVCFREVWLAKVVDGVSLPSALSEDQKAL